MGNFSRCKALKTRKMRKESRFCASSRHGPAERAARMSKARRAVRVPQRSGRLTVREGRRPHRSRSRSTAAVRRRRERDGNFPPCKALKTNKMRKESRFCANLRLGPVEKSGRRGAAPGFFAAAGSAIARRPTGLLSALPCQMFGYSSAIREAARPLSVRRMAPCPRNCCLLKEANGHNIRRPRFPNCTPHSIRA
jgi:hypothetical protein